LCVAFTGRLIGDQDGGKPVQLIHGQAQIGGGFEEASALQVAVA
jgi:hypothetical protein